MRIQQERFCADKGNPIRVFVVLEYVGVFATRRFKLIRDIVRVNKPPITAKIPDPLIQQALCPLTDFVGAIRAFIGVVAC
jgi:hypothetical protein